MSATNGQDPNRPLTGLAIIDRMRSRQPGMNKTLMLITPWLHEQAIDLHYIPVVSIFPLLRGLARITLKEKQYRFDFVLFNALASLTSPWASLIARFCILFGIPLFVYWHEMSLIFEETSQRSPASIKRADRIAAGPSVHHLVVSQASKEAIQQKYETASKAKVIYNAASIPVPFDHPVSPFTDRPLVLNIASIQFKKGTDLFVKTALEVCKRHDTVEFMWLGAGKHYGDYLDEIRTEGFENRILFPGYVDASFTLLRRAAVFFLSSREDSFPLANLEAMCLARRIVCFDVGGGPEALDGTGILIEPFDTAAAADAILTVLRRPEKDWLNMQARERYLGMFTPSKQAERLSAAIREIVNP